MPTPAAAGTDAAPCLCGETGASPYLDMGGKSLVRCRACRLVRTAGFRHAVTLYEGEGYFTGPAGYLQRRDTFLLLFEPILAGIRRIKPSGSLLDIGTGVGILLEAASRIGYDVKGVEVSEWASSYAREEKGLDVVTGTLEEARFADASFDVIVLNHVLEHVEEPKPLLVEIRRILREDGLLAVGAPNAGSLMAALLGARWASWRPEQHKWHFTRATLADLLWGTGFRVVRREARDSSPVEGWGPKELAQRAINAISRMTDSSESMLLFARKPGGGGP